MTAPTTTITVVNNTGSSNSYAYVNGLDLNNDNAPIFIQADGKTVYKPTSPAAEESPLSVDCAIPLGEEGSKTTITIPKIAGGRIWFVVDDKLEFMLNPGPATVEPSVQNPDDKNYYKKWAFAEFTYNDQQLFANISYVDFLAMPIALNLTNTDGKEQVVKGIPDGGLDQVVDKLNEQQAADGAGWDKLVIKGKDGKNLRALSPNSGRTLDASLFEGYYQNYVDQAWVKYSGNDLTIDTQFTWGTVKGRVQGDKLTFDAGTFAKPSAGDIFSCSTGPFANYPEDTKDVMGAIGTRISAALNRSTLIDNPDQPDAEDSSKYYKTNPTNHYARICHEVNIDGRGYTFPYDDVNASGDSKPDQAGTVFDGSPKELTITLGKYTASSAAEDGAKKGMLDRITSPVKNVASGAWKGVKKVMGGARNTLKGCFK